MSPQSFDVVIVGGGPAGIASALALQERGASALVVERSRYQEARVGETFPPAIKSVLIRLGLWEDFTRAGHVPSVGIRSFWGSSEPYEQSFIFNPYGMGWHVDRRAFDASLAQAACERGVQFAFGSRVLDLEPDRSTGWRLHITSRESEFDVSASYVMDATGRAATAAQRIGATKIAYDKLVGILGFFRKTMMFRQPEPFTLIEATESGWWYSVPLPGDNLVVAYMTDADLHPHGSTRDASYWTAQLERAPHTLERTVAFILDGKLRVAPAYSSRLVPLSGKGWVAVGDAATAYDPLSGDGVCRALQAGIDAAGAVLAEQSGDESALRRHSEIVAEEFESYLILQETYYSREERWPKSSFWERRRDCT